MFLTYGWYEERWFAEEVQGDDCTPAQRESVLQHTLAVLQDEFLTNLSAVTDTGIVSKKLFMSVALVRLHNQGNQKVAGQQMTIVALFSGCYWTFFYLCFPPPRMAPSIKMLTQPTGTLPCSVWTRMQHSFMHSTATMPRGPWPLHSIGPSLVWLCVYLCQSVCLVICIAHSGSPSRNPMSPRYIHDPCTEQHCSAS